MALDEYGRSQPRHPSTSDDGSAGNLLIAALDEVDRARLLQSSELVPLPVGMTIYEAEAKITHVYFVVRGIVSMVSEMDEGTVEVGTVGREGMTGLPIVLHADSMPTRAFVQVEGEGLCVRADDLRAAMRSSPALERLLSRYALALFDQAAQNAACNRLHALEARCARWLLTTHDRVGGDVLPLKQTFLAQMLGVHRPAVTVAAGALQSAGMIRYARGKLTVVDRRRLEGAACRCYAITRRNYEELLANERAPASLDGTYVRNRT